MTQPAASSPSLAPAAGRIKTAEELLRLPDDGRLHEFVRA